MTITIGSFTTSRLTLQPYAYEAANDDARDGLTARTFRLGGLLLPEEWQALLTTYETWRDARIEDEDTLKSLEVGTTVPVSIDGVFGVSVSNLACWFTRPPASEQFGRYMSVGAVLVDANQALQVLIRSIDKDRQRSDAAIPDLGTVTLGSCVVKLLAPMKTRRDGPQVSFTAAGKSYITGPLTSHKVREITGHIIEGDYDDLLAWYDAAISGYPAAGSWFPVTAPTASAEVLLENGVRSTRYTVQVAALQIR